MPQQVSTSWTLVLATAHGSAADQEEFARIYAPVVEAYLNARWRGARADEIGDVVQEVMLDCVKPDGALASINPEKCPSFRGYLYGVTRIAALREEARARKRPATVCPEVVAQQAADDPSLVQAFDLAFGGALVQVALERLLRLHADPETAALRHRVLQLRYVEGLTPADIAESTGMDVKRVYRHLEAARADFRVTFMSVVAEHHQFATRSETLDECEAILRSLAAV